MEFLNLSCCCSQNYTEGVSYANVPYPKQMLAAMANIDEAFPGSCGRCFEVRPSLAAALVPCPCPVVSLGADAFEH